MSRELRYERLIRAAPERVFDTFTSPDGQRELYGTDRAGVLDELEIHLVPVLLGEGRRLFAHLGPDHIELERVRVVEGEGGVTHLRYRVVAA